MSMVIPSQSIEHVCDSSSFIDEKFEQARKFKQAIQELLRVFERDFSLDFHYD